MIKKMCVYCLLFLISFNSLGVTKPDLEFANVNGHSLKLDLYFPEQVPKKLPVVVWIHGGGWHAGDKSKCSIKWMTDHGFAVASISYRLTQVAFFPAQIHDCKAAIRWLKANAQKYNLDSQKFAVAGSSAGGMLAALVGTSGGDDFCEGSVGGNLKYSSSVKAVIDFYGATDFVLRSKTQPKRANEPGSVVYKLLGGGANEKVELAQKASAITYVDKNAPPFLVFHGAKDKVVLPDQSEAIAKAYKALGLELDYVVIPNGGHGGKDFFTPETKKKMIDFLKKNLQ
ncbi:MAG: alpha/beta hydrolase [Lentisphaerales bacterium]|nr:alpha/beta hydrolase [Lentisphaerales bacterium]